MQISHKDRSRTLTTMQTEQQKKEIQGLEATIARETEKLLALKQMMDRDNQLRPTLKKNTFNNERDAKFYQDNLKRVHMEKVEADLRNLRVESISCKQGRIAELKKVLGEFDGVEPTNESLQAKIEELKNSRLSLDMSFDDIL